MTNQLRIRLLASQYDLMSAVDAIKSATTALGEFDRAPPVDDGNGTTEITWISESGEIIVFLSDDSLNQILRIDIAAPSGADAESLANRIRKQIDVQSFSELLSDAQPLSGRALEDRLVRLAQVAPVGSDHEQLTSLVQKALADEFAGARKSAVFAAYLVRSPELIELIAGALAHESDAELQELMRLTVQQASEPQGPRSHDL